MSPAVGAVEVHALPEVGFGSEADAGCEIPEQIDGSVESIFVVAAGGSSVMGQVAALTEGGRHEDLRSEVVLQAGEVAPSWHGVELSGFFGVGHKVIFAKEKVAAEV